MDVENLQADAAEFPLHLASTGALTAAENERYSCPACHKSRCLYCAECCTWKAEIQPAVPKVRLPIPVIIIKHPGELATKSTAIHAKLLAPEDVEIRDWEDANCTSDLNTNDEALVDYLLFPSSTSLPVDRVRGRIRRLIVIDGTWTQAKKIARETPALAKLPAVHLQEYATLFWRYQTGLPRHYLATIEAISFFFREYSAKLSDEPTVDSSEAKETSNADNLLWLFVYNLGRVQRHYASHPPTVKIARHQLEHLCRGVRSSIQLQQYL